MQIPANAQLVDLEMDSCKACLKSGQFIPPFTGDEAPGFPSPGPLSSHHPLACQYPVVGGIEKRAGSLVIS